MHSKYSLLHGDCIQLLQSLPDHSVDLVLTDPPFGCTKADWDKPLDLSALWAQLRRVLKKTGTVLLFGYEGFTVDLINSNRDWYRYRYVWVKSRPSRFMDYKVRPMPKFEDIVVFMGGALSLPGFTRNVRSGISHTRQCAAHPRLAAYGSLTTRRQREPFASLMAQMAADTPPPCLSMVLSPAAVAAIPQRNQPVCSSSSSSATVHQRARYWTSAWAQAQLASLQRCAGAVLSAWNSMTTSTTRRAKHWTRPMHGLIPLL